MAKKKILKENGKEILPITHEKCVLDNNGVSLADKIGDMDTLMADSDDLVSAINEVTNFNNNFKGLIADSIGSPISADDSFNDMRNDINSLLSQFKTNMMNAGVVVESGDKFESLIEKIKGLTEGEGNKGIQYATGTASAIPVNGSITITMNLDFNPTVVFCHFPIVGFTIGDNNTYKNLCICSLYPTMSDNYASAKHQTIKLTNLTKNSFKLTASPAWSDHDEEVYTEGDISWYAIGVGEEDTTLRDSLADILEDEGVNVTEEDDMADLITKTDEEFDNKKQMIVTLLNNKGINVDINSSWEELLTELNKLNITVPELNLNTWTEGTPMSVARYNPAAVAVGTDLYVIGGYNTTSSKANEKYDSLTGTWTSKTNINTDCSMTTGASINGIVYVVDNKFLGSYNPTTDTWTTLKSIPLRYGYLGCRAHNYNNELIIYGEAYEQGNKMFKYVPSSGTLTEITPEYQYMYEYNALAMVLVNDKIYAPGGYYIDDEHHAQNTSSIYTISPIDAEYGYTSASLGSYCHYKELFGFAINQKAYFCGGFYYSDYSDTVETSLKVWCLDTFTGSLTNTADLPFFLYEPGMAVINDVAYIVGGRTDYSTYSNKLIIYKP